MSVTEREKNNQVPHPFNLVLEEPDLRLDQLRENIRKLHIDTDDLNKEYWIEVNTVEKKARDAEISIKQLSQAHDASRKYWTILGTAFFFLAAVNLMKSGTAVWRWYKRNRSRSGDNQEQRSEQDQTLRRTHPREWKFRE